jgi:23S rRNA-/tRNA-specific pseudouridylate synthase
LTSGETGDETVEPLRLVHRLDKRTSGVLVLARSRLAAAKFSALLQHERVHKTYEALIQSNDTAEAVLRDLPRDITLPIDGKPARTIVERVLRSNSAHRGVWLELKPVTGRKHQLRVHCATGLGTPIVGDAKYGGARAERLFLHAKRIQFKDPFDPDQREIDVTCAMEQE